MDVTGSTGNDPAVRRLLDDLIATLEPVIDEAFAVDYGERVKRARRAILAEGG